MLRRRGVSLIEILFSIGILAIGVLGVMALAPLALYQLGQGNISDRSSRLGLNAVEEFHIRGMGDVTTWRSYMTPPSVPSVGFWPVASFTDDLSIAIDPLLLSVPANVTATTAPVNRWFPNTMPAVSLIRMDRISLRSTPYPNSPLMSQLHAEKIFVMPDDLVFSQPDDKLKPPRQQFTWTEGADGAWGVSGVDDDNDGATDNVEEAGFTGSDDLPTVRQTRGQFSWMATLTPRFEGYSAAAVTNPDAALYTLTVVVFDARNLDASYPLNERVTVVTSFYGDGTSGGDISLSPHTSSTTPEDDLKMKEGNWLMLAGTTLPNSFGVTRNVFNWYRIDKTDTEPIINAGVLQLDVTITGPDWPVVNLNKPAGWPTGTQAVLVDDVVGVYQKTIHLEGSSLWSG